jgi:hypothetical protein
VSSPPDQPDQPDQRDPAAESVVDPQELADRRRRLSDVFGDVLPDSTSDDIDDGAADAGRDAEIRRDVPPHHGSREMSDD